MFCAYCGKTMLDDMKFCPYCGKEVRIPKPEQEEVQPVQQMEVQQPVYQEQQPVYQMQQPVYQEQQPVYQMQQPIYQEQQPQVQQMVQQPVQSNGTAVEEVDDWEFYNKISVDTKDLPVVQGPYLTLGTDSLLLSDIVSFEVDRGLNNSEFSITDKYGKKIEIKIKAGGTAPLIAPLPMIAAAEKKIHRLNLQMMRIAPLCGDETLKKQAKLAAKILEAYLDSLIKNGRLEITAFVDAMKFAKQIEEDEYPIFVTGNSTWRTIITNKNHKLAIANVEPRVTSLSDITVFRKGPGTYNVFLKGTANKIAVYSVIKKEQEDVMNQILQYYNEGRIDEFVRQAYRSNLGIVKW